MAISQQFIDEQASSEVVKALVDLRPWMRYKRLELITSLDDLDKFIDEAVDTGLCAVDTETSGLNSGPMNRGRGSQVAVLAGICLAYHKDYGVYIPVGHFEGRNLPLAAVMERMRRLLSSCITIYHNAKYDFEILRNQGIIMEDPKKYRDTLLGAAVLWSDRETKGLKPLVRDFLGKEMIELKEIAPGKKHIDFRTIHPKDAVFYAASDAICTLELYEYEQKLLADYDPNKNNGLHFVYEVEHACQIVVAEMERNLVKINTQYYRSLADRVDLRKKDLEDEIIAAAGQPFEIGSNKQLGEILFDKLKIHYPIAEKSKTGDYFVKDEILEKIADKHPLPRLIQEFREMEKVYNTYLMNLLKNVDENSCVKFQLNQTAADSGRFSATGGKGILVDGYSGVNCQNIPATKKDDQWKLRYGIVARPGFKIVTIDYSGEELRIATNLSKEPVWTEEFVNGTGDLHSITAALLFHSTPAEMAKPENKGLRSIGKQINFLILYGGGASKLAASAKIPMAEAQERLEKFFLALTSLSDWLKTERIRAKRRGYSLTAFGRRRPLADLYKSGDRGLMSKADRLACNAAIQGCLKYSTRVLTNKGYIKIGKVLERNRKGEQFEVWTGHSWAPFHALNRGACELAEVTLANGHRVDCDTRHQVLVVGEKGYEFRHYDKLEPKDLVCLSPYTAKEFGEYPFFEAPDKSAYNKVSFSIPKEDTQTWAEVSWLLGVITGDGFISNKKKSITLCFGREKIESLLPRVNSLMGKLGITCGSPRKVVSARGESYQVSYYSTTLVDLLKQLGVTDKPAREKVIPEAIWESPLKMRKEFLRGYWDTDGCKKKVNRYGFHTPNYELLREVATLGRTLGLSSKITSDLDGAFSLSWTDLLRVEETLGLPPTKSHYRTMSKGSVVPDFALQSCLSILEPLIDRTQAKERAILSKLKTGKRVSVGTVLMLCEKYGVTPPQLYETTEVISKKSLGVEEETYTLSVQDEGHRFDGEGVIHKNTGADIIKIALYRVWSYIRKNNLHNDVRILMPIHDEIVYEIREDKLDTLVPAISEIMKIRDLTNALGWKVHLEVDAEYDDTFMVKKNYFEDLHKYGINASMRMGMSDEDYKKVVKMVDSGQANSVMDAFIDNSEKSTETTIDIDTNINNENLKENPPESEEEKLSSVPMQNNTQSGISHTLSETERPLMEEVPDELLDSHSPSEFFNYEVTKSDKLAKAHTEAFWSVLEGIDPLCKGVKRRIRLTRDKKVIYTTAKKYSVEGFLALAFNYTV